MFGLPPELLMGFATGVASFFAKNAAMKRQDQRELMELAIRQNKQDNDNANQAAKRSSPVLRKIVASIIILSTFGGLLLVAFHPDIPTTMLIDGKTKSVLFGLISWTSKPEIISANGYFLADFVRFGAYQVISFLFGSSLAKATR